MTAAHLDDPARPEFQKHGKQNAGVVATEERVIEVKAVSRLLVAREKKVAMVFRQPLHHRYHRFQIDLDPPGKWSANAGPNGFHHVPVAHIHNWRIEVTGGITYIGKKRFQMFTALPQLVTLRNQYLVSALMIIHVVCQLSKGAFLAARKRGPAIHLVELLNVKSGEGIRPRRGC